MNFIIPLVHTIMLCLIFTGILFIISRLYKAEQNKKIKHLKKIYVFGNALIALWIMGNALMTYGYRVTLNETPLPDTPYPVHVIESEDTSVDRRGQFDKKLTEPPLQQQ